MINLIKYTTHNSCFVTKRELKRDFIKICCEEPYDLLRPFIYAEYGRPNIFYIKKYDFYYNFSIINGEQIKFIEDFFKIDRKEFGFFLDGNFFVKANFIQECDDVCKKYKEHKQPSLEELKKDYYKLSALYDVPDIDSSYIVSYFEPCIGNYLPYLDETKYVKKDAFDKNYILSDFNDKEERDFLHIREIAIIKDGENEFYISKEDSEKIDELKKPHIPYKIIDGRGYWFKICGQLYESETPSYYEWLQSNIGIKDYMLIEVKS